MKCRDCDYKMEGFFACESDKYACIGVKEPFILDSLDNECPAYPEYREYSKVKTATIAEPKPAKAYVGDNGIYVPSRYDSRLHEILISRELFVEAYNKGIKNDSYGFIGQDDADDWSED